MDKINIGVVFDRICAEKGMSQEELGKRFNKTPQSMSQHRTNNTFDLRLLIEAFPDVDLNWLFKGSPAEGPASSPEQIPLPLALQTVLDAGYGVTPRVLREEPIRPET